jgi:hypothetical protein
MSKLKNGEIDVMISGPASYTNRFVAVATPAGVRVAFLESAPDSDVSKFRAAVLLSFQDAIELRDLLTEIVEPVEKKLKTVFKKSI